MDYIYTLTDPRSGAVRYVGQTCAPKRRLKDHLHAARKNRQQHVARWIRGLLADDLRPVMELVEETREADAAERQWIARLRASGCDLLNANDGGRGVARGWTMPPEARERIRAHFTGVPKTPAHRAALSASLMGHKRSAESVEASRKGLLGRKHSTQRKANIAAGQRAAWARRKSEALPGAADMTEGAAP